MTKIYDGSITYSSEKKTRMSLHIKCVPILLICARLDSWPGGGTKNQNKKSPKLFA